MPETNPLPSRLFLRVVEAPDAADRGLQIVLGDSPVTVGRGEGCSLRIIDPGVALRHLSVQAVAGKARVLDQGSDHGFWVGEEMKTEAVLPPGAVLRLGATTLAVVEEAGGEGGWLTAAAAEGEAVPVAGNRPLVLTDTASVWWVQEGAVDLFVESHSGHNLRSERLYLGTIGAGGLLFPQPPSSTGSVLFVTGKSGTAVRRLDGRTLDCWSADASRAEEIAAAVAPWSQALRNALGTLPGATDISVFLPDSRPAPSLTEAAARLVVRLRQGGLWISLDRLASSVIRAAEQTSEIHTRTAREQQLLRKEESQKELAEAERLLQEIGRRQIQLRPLGADTPELLLKTLQEVAWASGIELAKTRLEGERGFEDEVEALAGASRVRLRKVALRGTWWKEDHGPLLGRTLEGAPVALIPGSRLFSQRYVVLDLARGSREVLDERRAELLSAFAFMLYRPLPTGPVPSVLHLCRFAFAGLRAEAVHLALAGIGIGLLGSAIPLLTGWLIDSAVTAADRSLLTQCALGLLVVSLSVPVLKAFENLTALRLEGRVDLSLQAALWDRLLTLPAGFFRGYEAGDLAERVVGVHKIRTLLAKAARTAVMGGIGSVFYLGLMVWYSWKLTAVGVLTAFFLVVVSLGIAWRQLTWQGLLADREGRVSALLLQLLSGIGKIRVAAAESHALGQWVVRFREQLEATMKAGWWQNWAAICQSTFPVLAPVALFLVAAPPLRDPGAQGLSTGQLIAFLSAFGLFTTAVLSLGEVSLRFAEAVPVYRRMRPILDSESESDARKLDPGLLQGEIRLSHVSFRYVREGPPVLDDVNLHIRPGEFVALVGASGSGKSTLLRLLLGFERPESGGVYYDNQELSSLDLSAVRRQIGVVLQTSKPFAADILQNIVGASSLGKEAAEGAARRAGFDRDVEQMPMRWNTYVGEEGANLSGGQRQRLMIARALLRNPKIVFMDEATSALDNRTQAIVAESLDRLQATRVVVAHRLSTIRNAHRIVMMAHGRIVAEGKFEELLEKSPEFAQLARRQIL